MCVCVRIDHGRGAILVVVVVMGGFNYTAFTLEFQQYWHMSPEYKIQKQLKTFIPPILFLIGGTGNILSYLTLKRKAMHKSSTYVYMASLSLSNTLILYIGCGSDWVSHISSKKHVANQADWICRLWMFAFNVIMYSASWLVVAMTIDRFVWLYYPLRAPHVCTSFVAKVITIIILIGLVTVSIHAMWTYEMTGRGCSVDPNHKDFHRTVWPWISASLYTYVPILIMFIFNILNVIGMLHTSAGRSAKPAQDQLTRVTLLVSMTFLTLSLPTVILNVIQYINPQLIFDYRSYSRIILGSVICNMISCLNYSINFILYFAGVPLFRVEFFALFGHRKKTVETVEIVEEAQTLEVNGELETKEKTEATTVWGRRGCYEK